MVTPEGTGVVAESGDTTLSKIRGALSSGLMTAQDRVTNKLGSGNKQPDVPPEPPKPEEPPPPKPVVEAGKPISRSGTCRVCLKAFKPEDFSKTCGECQQKVCEDCASYSKPEDAQDDVSTDRALSTVRPSHFLFHSDIANQLFDIT
ncbi:parallel actin filament bundle assembly [Nesidiocoris tenuis]|uniref:Parallel actin filament bundle assembly n=1 Tax=Nesidiocoris tenuis TaxID=355587 RepID=A0ABN7BFD8_9HEMI|nr:parallel actin filament bundle assembly [Nesidiocoris tenuis]